MIEYYEKAGSIVSQVRNDAIKLIKNELPVLDLINFVENQIKELGGSPAFPCNVSINEITAHYTSPPNDETLIKAGDMVKLDLGAHVNGYIADTAVTIIAPGYGELSKEEYSEEKLAKNEQMVEASQEALTNAISSIREGVKLEKVGAAVEDTINSFGFKPVANLTGHSMDQWILHSGISIPNIKGKNDYKLEEGDVLAIEPFATEGVGLVTDSAPTYIFRFLRDRPMRMVLAQKVLNHVKSNYKTLPFTQRWLTSDFNEKRLKAAMRLLIQSRAIYPFNVLTEKSNGWVSQSEHTIIVEKEGCQIITQ